LSWAAPEASPAAAESTVFLARWVMFLFTAVILGLTAWLGALWRDLRTGLVLASINTLT